MYCNKSLITTLKACIRKTEVAWREQAAKGDTEGARGKAPEAFKWPSHLMNPYCHWHSISTEELKQATAARENSLGNHWKDPRKSNHNPSPACRPRDTELSKAAFVNWAGVKRQKTTKKPLNQKKSNSPPPPPTLHEQQRILYLWKQGVSPSVHASHQITTFRIHML